MRKTYRGDAIEVTFDLDRCIHVGECLLSQPDVFDLRRRPWIDPNADDPDTVAATVERCPSGALQYRRLDGGAGRVARVHVRRADAQRPPPGDRRGPRPPR